MARSAGSTHENRRGRSGVHQKSQGIKVPRPAKAGSKAERDALRQEMLVGGCSLELIATEMERRWGFRPREAYRHAHGWSQDEVAARFTEVAERLGGDRPADGRPAVPAAPMIGTRIGEYERWPNGGRRPSPYVLTVLATVLGTTVERLLDYDDHRKMPDQERTVLAAVRAAATPSVPAVAATPTATPARRPAPQRPEPTGRAALRSVPARPTRPAVPSEGHPDGPYDTETEPAPPRPPTRTPTAAGSAAHRGHDRSGRSGCGPGRPKTPSGSHAHRFARRPPDGRGGHHGRSRPVRRVRRVGRGDQHRRRPRWSSSTRTSVGSLATT